MIAPHRSLAESPSWPIGRALQAPARAGSARPPSSRPLAHLRGGRVLPNGAYIFWQQVRRCLPAVQCRGRMATPVLLGVQ
jgi:hypothetical protein